MEGRRGKESREWIRVEKGRDREGACRGNGGGRGDTKDREKIITIRILNISFY